MRILEYLVPEEWDGASVKEFVRSYLDISSSVLTKQKRLERGILQNGEPCRSITILKTGDVLAFRLPEEEWDCPVLDRELSILFENEDYLVVDKPAGMPVHPSPGHDCDSLMNAVAFYFRKSGQNSLFRPLYRLDKDTSGIVILGKHRIAVSSAKVKKVYYAVCQGTLSGAGTIDLPIGLKEDSKIVRECGHGDRAVTHWRALASGEGHTFVSIRLETGRTHQIRAHFSWLGHPLAGDDLYGGSRERFSRQALHCGRALLCCKALSLNRDIETDIPLDIREAFPWLPPWEKVCKEEPICPHV